MRRWVRGQRLGVGYIGRRARYFWLRELLSVHRCRRRRTACRVDEQRTRSHQRSKFAAAEHLSVSGVEGNDGYDNIGLEAASDEAQGALKTAGRLASAAGDASNGDSKGREASFDGCADGSKADDEDRFSGQVVSQDAILSCLGSCSLRKPSATAACPPHSREALQVTIERKTFRRGRELRP